MNKLFTFLLLAPFSVFAANYVKMSDRIVKRYNKEVAKPKRLCLSGSGGAMMDDIKKVILNYQSFDSLNIDEGRVLFVDMMEEFLVRMNQNEKIRPYLHNYPFGVENFKLRIGFDDSKRNIIGDGHVALMFVNKNQDLLFEAYDQETGKFYTLHREPYAESLRIVQGE
ncbi:MAG: hypothetical protein S4CHLAM2_09900 [Chlamydiales bacterium]|nr:hypothetical protein [Chlamydiales bacterium]